MRDTLKSGFETKDWSEGQAAPRSGFGSSIAYTTQIRAFLPDLFVRHGVRHFVDAPCGDWHWMREVDLSGVNYLGIDISEELIAANVTAHARDGVRFAVSDITSDPLPKADLLMCRDCLFHLKFWLRWEFFRNFAASGTKLLLTTFHHIDRNRNVRRNGDFAKFDPALPPFCFEPPVEVVHETVETDADGKLRLSNPRGGPRSMGLWTRDQVVRALAATASATSEAPA